MTGFIFVTAYNKISVYASLGAHEKQCDPKSNKGQEENKTNVRKQSLITHVGH